MVVAIIALLIAILLPSLGKARGNARTSACLANMHAIGQGSVTYNSMYDGFMVPQQWSTAAGNGNPSDTWQSLFIHDGILAVQEYAKDPNCVAAVVAGTKDSSFHTRTVFACPEASLNTYHRMGQNINYPSPWLDVNNPIVVDTWYELNAQAPATLLTWCEHRVWKRHNASVSALRCEPS